MRAGAAIVVISALLALAPAFVAGDCTVSEVNPHETHFLPNVLGQHAVYSAAFATTFDEYCQFATTGDGTLTLVLENSGSCLPLCSEGYMANGYYECGTGTLTHTPTCVPATKMSLTFTYGGDTARRAGSDLVGATTATAYNGDDAAGVKVRDFFNCAVYQLMMDSVGTVAPTTAEGQKAGKGTGNCILGTTTATTAPWAAKAAVISGTKAVPLGTIKSSATGAGPITITFVAYALSTEAVAAVTSTHTTILQAKLKTNVEGITAALLSTTAIALLACGSEAGALQTSRRALGDCQAGADNDGPFGLTAGTGFASHASNDVDAGDFTTITGAKAEFHCPASLLSPTTFFPTVYHADMSKTCKYGVPVGGSCAPVCNSNFMPTESYGCKSQTTSGATAVLDDARASPTCAATSSVTFSVAYVDAGTNAYPANTASLAAYNGDTGGAAGGLAARAFFNCAALEVVFGTPANAGGSTGKCILTNVGDKDVAETGMENGGAAVTTNGVKLLSSTSADMQYATISSVASAQVTNGFTITFTLKFVPTGVSATATKTEAEVATAVNAVTTTTFNAALAAVKAAGDSRFTTYSTDWPCYGASTTAGNCRLTSVMTVANEGLWDTVPAAADFAAADFTLASPVLATSTPICYPAATPSVGNLPTSVTNGYLNSCGQALPAGTSCTYNCSSGYTANAITTFECSASGTAAYVAPNVGNMTCTAPAAASNASSTCTYGATSTCATRISQSLVISSLAVADYTGNLKSTYECSYAKMVSATWCTATTGAVTYLSGVQVASTAAARRAATITFVMDVETSVMTAAAVQTAVQSGVTAANLVTQMTAMNIATGWGVTVPAAGDITVNTATFSGAATSSAAVAIPSAIMVLLGSLISLFWN